MAKSYSCGPVNTVVWVEDLQHALLPNDGCRPYLAMDGAQPIYGGGRATVWGQVCALCQSHNHRKEEYALAPPSAGNDQCPHPYRVMEEVCHCFNRLAGCSSSKYWFDHKYWSCGAPNHGAPNCRIVKPEAVNPTALPRMEWPCHGLGWLFCILLFDCW